MSITVSTLSCVGDILVNLEKSSPMQTLEETLRQLWKTFGFKNANFMFTVFLLPHVTGPFTSCVLGIWCLQALNLSLTECFQNPFSISHYSHICNERHFNQVCKMTCPPFAVRGLGVCL